MSTVFVSGSFAGCFGSTERLEYWAALRIHAGSLNTIVQGARIEHWKVYLVFRATLNVTLESVASDWTKPFQCNPTIVSSVRFQ